MDTKLADSERSHFHLPRIRRDRFVTTTLKNVGAEDEANIIERGERLKHPEAVFTNGPDDMEYGSGRSLVGGTVCADRTSVSNRGQLEGS